MVPLAGTLNRGVSKMKLYAKWETDYLEVFFSADGEVTDYGVQGSPTWVEATDVTLEEVLILGVELPLAKMPQALRDAFYALSEEVEFEE